jgi:hypothetical protein
LCAAGCAGGLVWAQGLKPGAFSIYGYNLYSPRHVVHHHAVLQQASEGVQHLRDGEVRARHLAVAAVAVAFEKSKLCENQEIT